MALTPANINEDMTLQTKMAEKERQFTEKDTSFLQSLNVTGGAANLLRDSTKTEHILDRPDDKDTMSENHQADFLHKVDAEEWGRLHPEAEPGQGLWNKRDEQDVHPVLDDPSVPSSLQCLERSTPELSRESTFLKLNYWNTEMSLHAKELGADHLEWMEKINNIIQKIHATESTMKSLLNEVTSLEDQTENLEDQNQGANIEEKIVAIRKQLKEMNDKLVKVDACNEAHELKEKLMERIENFYKEMNRLNTKLGMCHTEERESDSYSSEEMDMQETEPLLQISLPSPGSSSPHWNSVWKHALKVCIVCYVVILTGLSCYILFVDATFIFERVLPSMLGRRTMWELREMVAPFLNLEVEDLLPS